MHQEGLPEPAHWLTRWRGFFLFILLALILMLGWVNVALQHQTRHLETRYAQALTHQQALKAEWGKLMLEKSHLTARARVQSIAMHQLHLKMVKDVKHHNYQTIYLPKAPQKFASSEKEHP